MTATNSAETVTGDTEIHPVLLVLLPVCCRRKLAKKSEECDNLLKECDRRNTLIAGLTADRDKAAANAAAAQAKLRKAALDNATAGPHIPAVDASKVRLSRRYTAVNAAACAHGKDFEAFND
jgi:hypothetical protein